MFQCRFIVVCLYLFCMDGSELHQAFSSWQKKGYINWVIDRKQVTSAEQLTGKGLHLLSNWQEKGYISWAIDRKRVTSTEQLTGKGLHQLSSWQEKGYINWAINRKRVTPAEQLTGKGFHQLMWTVVFAGLPEQQGHSTRGLLHSRLTVRLLW